MKNIDLTKPVMEKIAVFEERRIGRRRRFLWIILFGLLATGLWWIGMTFYRLWEQQSFDVLTLFYQDSETISEYWQDVVLVFWEEVPQSMVFLTGIVFIALSVIWGMTRGKRRLWAAKLISLARFRQMGQNKKT